MSADEDVDEAMANARPPDSPDAVLARARIESALFGVPSSVARFHVLERLGKGGMGIVYAAYDPELDRGVALKMIHVPANARELALAEGKALAKLSHPNVVPVFDVGVVEDQVYIVMELVRGQILADWTRGQSVRAIVDAYRQAGAALAAAHDAGLVHRDFKPANAIVGNDGRLRVVDFGLACEAATRPNAAGTPRYMAPEQRDGEVTPAADQYSFCVALGDALAADAPRWVADVVARGRSLDPADRFASMHELLRALGRDPARVWKWRLGLGAVAVALGMAFFVGHSRANDAERCAGGAAELAAAWPERDREAQLARIGIMGTYGSELAYAVRQSVQAHAKSWVAGHRDACMAHRRGESSAALLDRRMVCLDRSRAALTAVADIVAHAEGRTLSEVAHAVSALPEPQACAALAVLNSDVDPPPQAAAAEVARLRRDLDRARVLVAAGRTTAARDLARQAATRLAAIPYGPLLAEAQLVEGHATLRTDPPAAIVAFDRALATALAHRRDAIAIEAWARRAWIIGTQVGDPATALGALDVMEALATRTPDATFARALLYNNAGSIELVRERRTEARAMFERALRHAEAVRGPGAVELAAIHRNLSLVTPDERARDTELALYRDTLARLLGPHHPDVLLMQYMRATTSLARPVEAMAVLATTCEEMKRHDALAATMASCLLELATLRDELGDRAAAITTLAQASGYPHPEQPEIEGLLALWRGDVTEAIALLEAALEAAPVTEATPFFQRFARANLELVYGRALRAAEGRGRDAHAAFERGLALLGSVDRLQAVAVQRRFAALNVERAAMAGSP
jgi:tetratricopeptide (TPR) repeat protein/predicted Ser/Thr protein kinase